jgi:septal ring factor EnvC (AmiA/AmiB activator)
MRVYRVSVIVKHFSLLSLPLWCGKGELEAAEAVLSKVDSDLAAMNKRLEEKTTEGSSLMQELEVMKSKVALTMADTARYKEEERLLSTKIATLQQQTNSRMTSPPSQSQQGQAQAQRSGGQSGPGPRGNAAEKKNNDEDCVIS